MYYYRCIQEEGSLPDIGSYTTFGIMALRCTNGRWQRLVFISDVSLDCRMVQDLASRCTQYQLHPCHLLDVVEDAI